MSGSFAVSLAARTRGLLTIPGLLQRLNAVNSEAKDDAAGIIEEAARHLQTLLAHLRGQLAIDIHGPSLNEDLDAYESVVEMLEDHAAKASVVKMVQDKFDQRG